MSDQRARYNEDGYVVIRGAFDAKIAHAARSAAGVGAIAVLDSHGARQELNVWTECGDDLLGVIPRSSSMVDLAEELVGEQVYHWHSKISWKKPHSAGTWDWHQDFGFWREEGCARPAMTTVSIALDRQGVFNGCLRVVPGSHRAGDIPHVSVGSGRSAEPATVDALIESNGIVDLELEPGDLVAFHCRTLHASGPNDSEERRSILHCSYNAITNGPTQPALAGHIVRPFERVPDSDIARAAQTKISGETPFISASDNGYANDGYTVLDGSGVLDGSAKDGSGMLDG